jgi:hypothetical protein
MVVWERLVRKISAGKPATSTALMVFIIQCSVFRIVILLGFVWFGLVWFNSNT